MGKKLAMVTALATIAVLVLPALVPAAGQGVRKLEAALDGGEEVPDKGDPNGRGLADVTVKHRKRKLCFDIEFSKIEAPVAGHVHKGRFGVAGDIVVPLFDDPTGATSPVSDCVKAKKDLLKKIKNKPEKYYVNLHNAEYPAGAIRGQLTER